MSQNTFNYTLKSKSELPPLKNKTLSDAVITDKKCNYHQLSEDFVREFRDKIDENYVYSFPELSENFIQEVKMEVNKLENKKREKKH